MYTTPYYTQFFGDKPSKNFETNLNYGGANSSVALLRTIVRAAHGSPTVATRFLFDGDSQETSPEGAGQAYVTLLNYNLWKTFGNIPESQLRGISAIGGSNTAGIMIATAPSGEAVASGDTATNRYPYSMEPVNNNRYTYNAGFGGLTGFLCLLQANFLTASASLTEIDRTVEYLSRTGLVFHVMMPYLLTQGNTIHLRSTTSADGAAAYFNADNSTSEVSTATAVSASNNWLKVDYTYNFGSNPPTAANLSTIYPEVVVAGGSAAPDAASEPGPGWFSSGTTKGIIVSDISAGGKSTPDQFTDRPNMLPFLQVYAPNVIIFACGANDSVNNVTAATFKTNVQAKINTYLATFPNMVFILMNDPAAIRNTAGQDAALAAYGTKLRELSLIAANRSVFIDRYKILSGKYGWTYPSGNIDTYVLANPDGVHYSVAGSRLVAIEDAAAILDMGS